MFLHEKCPFQHLKQKPSLSPCGERDRGIEGIIFYFAFSYPLCLSALDTSPLIRGERKKWSSQINNPPRRHSPVIEERSDKIYPRRWLFLEHKNIFSLLSISFWHSKWDFLCATSLSSSDVFSFSGIPFMTAIISLHSLLF